MAVSTIPTLLLAVSCGFLFTTHGAPTYLEAVETAGACSKLTAATIDLLDSYDSIAKALHVPLFPYDEAKNDTGYDFRKSGDVRKFSCELVETKTLKELASLIGEDYEWVKHQYAILKKEMAKLDGKEEIFKKVHIGMDLIIGLNGTNFPKFPLADKEYFVNFFTKKMVGKYGAAFLQEFYPLMPVMTDQIIDVLSTSLANVKSMKQLSAITNTPQNKLEMAGVMFQALRPHLIDVVKMVEATERIHDVFEEAGLYDLQ